MSNTDFKVVIEVIFEGDFIQETPFQNTLKSPLFWKCCINNKRKLPKDIVVQCLSSSLNQIMEVAYAVISHYFKSPEINGV